VPSTVSSFPTTVTLTVNATNVAAGAYQAVVQGASGSMTQNFDVPFDVGDYVIAGTQNLSVDPAGHATANLTLTSSFGYSGQINASCDTSALAGTQCTLSPANPISVSSGAAASVMAAFNVTNNAAPGIYNINIKTQDTSGAPSHTWMISLAVTQDFTLSALTPSSQSITPGESATYNFSVFPVGASFTNAVNFSCFGSPAPCTFTPSSVTPGNNSAAVVLTINTASSSANLLRFRSTRTAIVCSLWIALPALAILGFKVRGKERSADSTIYYVLSLLLLAFLLNSCGVAGSNGGGTTGGGGDGIGSQQQGTKPGTYSITVTGTSGALNHQSAPVTLVVNSQ
jgi:hypothetical protein